MRGFSSNGEGCPSSRGFADPATRVFVGSGAPEPAALRKPPSPGDTVSVADLRPKTILFCAILALAIALSVLLRGRRAVHWLFAAFAADVALWYASQSLAGFFRADVWERVTGVLTVLLPQFAIHLFQNVIPLEVRSTTTRLARYAAIAGVPVLALAVSPYHDRSFALGAVYTYVFGLLAAALITLARRGQRSQSRAVRDRVRFLIVVGAAATTFSLGDFLSYLGVRLPPIGAVLSIVFLFVLAESVTRPRLADLYEMAGRLVVFTALAFCLAAIFYMFVMVIGGFDTMYLNAVLAAIVFLVLFEPLQTEVERRIHQFLFRERYDLETSVGDLRKRLAHVLEIDEMVTTLMDGMDRSRRVTTAALYLRDQDGDGFDLVGSIGAAVPKRVEALGARPLLDRLVTQASLALEELSREKTDAAVVTAAAALGVLESAIVLVVRGDEDGHVGLLFVADDRVRDAFTPEEVSLLETVAVQIGVVVANCRIYSRMKERDRLAALGSMAAGLAHEVKNPLGAIKGAAQLLEEVGEWTSDDGAREFVGIILEEVNRLDRVVGSFLDYARPHAGNPIPLDLNAAVRRTAQILSSQITDDGIGLQLDLSERPPRAHIDPEKFRQVLMNLMQNAIQAMDGRGKVTISTSVRRSTRGRVPPQEASSSTMRRSIAEETELVEVSVRDTGPGISPKILRNLFVPFFTTKTKGTGLGLAISQSIVQNAGGTIEVQSQPGAGTTFTIVLPIASDALAGAVASEKTSVRAGRHSPRSDPPPPVVPAALRTRGGT
jgi:two-component system, NtrC family, sensor histidine kinase HydH